MSLSKLSVSVLAIGLSLISTSTMAQESETYMNVGETKDGQAINLDTKEIIGTDFKLYILSDNTLFEAAYQASCGEDRLFSTRYTIYGSNGVKLAEKRGDGEIPFNSKSPTGKSMVYVCRRIGARGW